MQLHTLVSKHKAKKSRRLGRGPGSGRGKTSARGHKGAKSRSGRHWYLGLEGGNVPFYRKFPKRGFNHQKRIKYQLVNTQNIDAKFKKDDEVTPLSLFSKNLIKKKDSPVKILGKGKLIKSLIVSAHKFSKLAKEKIEKAGGKVTCLTP